MLYMHSDYYPNEVNHFAQMYSIPLIGATPAYSIHAISIHMIAIYLLSPFPKT